jgi:hypothetical protein
MWDLLILFLVVSLKVLGEALSLDGLYFRLRGLGSLSDLVGLVVLLICGFEVELGLHVGWNLD